MADIPAALRRLLPEPTGCFCLVAALGFAGAGCTLALQVPGAQCEVDADCEALGEDFKGTTCVDRVCVDSAWSCLGKVEEPPGGDFPATIRIVDLIAFTPLPDASVELCTKLDPSCTSPVASGLAPDADGIVSVMVDTSFRGFFAVEAAGYVPVLSFVDPGSPFETMLVGMVSLEASAALGESIGTKEDPERGTLSIFTTDCDGQFAQGIQLGLSPDDGATGFYTVGSAVSRTATETDSSGGGGFVNVLPGTVTLTGTLTSTGQSVDTETAFVRKGTLTYQFMRPR